MKVGAFVQRYFVPKQNWLETEVKITNNDAHHIVRVMRLQIGDKIICNHPDGTAYLSSIKRIEGDIVYVQLEEQLTTDAELPVEVTILQGVPKGTKLELILQKGTELGASRFLFYDADRSVAKWKANKIKQKIDRYNKIVKEASEQCHRNIIPTIEYVGTLDDFLRDGPISTSTNLFAYEQLAHEEDHTTFYEQLQSVKQGDHIMICIGPEGGFTEREANLLLKEQFKPIRLGKRILRTETASLYALASISYHFEEMECQSCRQ